MTLFHRASHDASRPDGDQLRDTATGLWRVVAGHEITVRIKEKSFVIGTIVSVLVIIAGIVAISWFDGRDKDRAVGVVDPHSAQVVETAGILGHDADDSLTIDVSSFADAAAAERAVEDGDVDAALLPTDDGFEIVGDRNIDSDMLQALRSAVSMTAFQNNASAQDVDLEALQIGSKASQRLLDPAAKDAGLRQIASMAFVVLFLLTALGFGMSIAASVTQEKESRVVEILAAAVPIRQLLWGKIVGNTVLAIVQMLVLVFAAVAGIFLAGESTALRVIGAPMLWYVLFFVLGFGALASLWCVAGSLASRQQDLQSTTMPAQMLLLGPYFLAFVAGEGVRTVVSMLPVVSTMLMPARMAEGSVPGWQIAVAIGGTALTAFVMVRVGAAVYERTLLRTGDKISYRDALRSSADS